MIILGTKFLYEAGSAESRPVNGKSRPGWHKFLQRHSLLIFLAATGLGWTALFLRLKPEGKWGQVVGNVVSEWVQMAGLVFLTKRLVEIGSKESRSAKLETVQWKERGLMFWIANGFADKMYE